MIIVKKNNEYFGVVDIKINEDFGSLSYDRVYTLIRCDIDGKPIEKLVFKTSDTQQYRLFGTNNPFKNVTNAEYVFVSETDKKGVRVFTYKLKGGKHKEKIMKAKGNLIFDPFYKTVDFQDEDGDSISFETCELVEKYGLNDVNLKDAQVELTIKTITKKFDI